MNFKTTRILFLSLLILAGFSAVFGQPENELLSRARTALKNSDYETALRETENILKTAPRHYEAALLKTEILQKQNKLKEALALADDQLNYLRLNPAENASRIAGFLSRRGNINNQTANYKAAHSDFSQAIELAPNLPDGYLGRAVSADYLNLSAKEIEKDYLKAYQIDKTNQRPVIGMTRFCNSAKEAVNSCPPFIDEYIRLFPDSISGYYTRANYNLRHILANPKKREAKQLEQVSKQILGDFQKISELDPTMSINPEIGRTYFYLGNYDEAARYYEKALNKHPRFPQALIYRGDLSLARGDETAALADYAAALAVNSKLEEPYVSRGKIYLKQGKFDEAAREFGKASEINSSEENLWLEVYALYQKGDYASSYARMQRMPGFKRDGEYNFGKSPLPVCRVNYINADLRQRLNASSSVIIRNIFWYAAGQSNQGYDENDKQCVAEAAYKYVDFPDAPPREARNTLNSLRDRNISAPNLEEKIRIYSAKADEAERREMAAANQKRNNENLVSQSAKSGAANAPSKKDDPFKLIKALGKHIELTKKNLAVQIKIDQLFGKFESKNYGQSNSNGNQNKMSAAEREEFLQMKKIVEDFIAEMKDFLLENEAVLKKDDQESINSINQNIRELNEQIKKIDDTLK